MAFVRWRGKCAQLLTTIYSDKGSKQVTLANLPDFHVTKGIKNEVEQKYPGINVDWIKVARMLAKGPANTQKEKTPDKHQDMAEVESRLRTWAAETGETVVANRLNFAADALLGLRARFYYDNIIDH